MNPSSNGSNKNNVKPNRTGTLVCQAKKIIDKRNAMLRKIHADQ